MYYVVQFLKINSLLTPFLTSQERAFFRAATGCNPFRRCIFQRNKLHTGSLPALERIDVAISCAFNELFLVVEISISRESRMLQ